MTLVMLERSGGLSVMAAAVVMSSVVVITFLIGVVAVRHETKNFRFNYALFRLFKPLELGHSAELIHRFHLELVLRSPQRCEPHSARDDGYWGGLGVGEGDLLSQTIAYSHTHTHTHARTRTRVRCGQYASYSGFILQDDDQAETFFEQAEKYGVAGTHIKDTGKWHRWVMTDIAGLEQETFYFEHVLDRLPRGALGDLLEGGRVG